MQHVHNYGYMHLRYLYIASYIFPETQMSFANHTAYGI